MRVCPHQAGLCGIGLYDKKNFGGGVSSAEFVVECGCLAGLRHEGSRLTRGPGKCRVGGHEEGIEMEGNKISRAPFFDYQQGETMLAHQSVIWFVVPQQGQNSRSS